MIATAFSFQAVSTIKNEINAKSSLQYDLQLQRGTPDGLVLSSVANGRSS